MATNSTPRKLYRSEKDRMVGGVCGGLAEYFAIDPAVVRLLFVVGFVVGFSSTFWIYVILWLILPAESSLKLQSGDYIQGNVDEIKQTATKVAKGIQSAIKGEQKEVEKEKSK